MSASPQTAHPSVSFPSIRRLLTLPGLLTVAIVGTGLVRLAAAFERRPPLYLPDEFLYSQLARSLGHGEGIRILGQPSPFPALLEPITTAAFWLPGNAELAYRLTQSLHTVAMVAAAIPVYLVARRLGLSSRSAWTAVVLSIVAPGLVYASYLTADALGYLLALTTITVGVRMVESGSKWSQVWFLVLAVAAISARSQYVVLIPAFLIAAMVVDRGRIVEVGRRLPVIAGAVVIAGIAAIVAGPSLLGRYQAVTSFGLSWETGRWVAVTLLLLTIATGVVVVPGAVAWLGATLLRPHARAQTAFAAFVSAFAVGLIVASAVISVETDSQRFFERYLIVLVPLLVLAFLCWLEDRRRGHWVAAAIGAAIIALAALVPLSTYAEGQGRADSPTLQMVSLLSDWIGIGSASLTAAMAITAAAIIGVLAALWYRVPRAVVIGTALVCLATVSISAHAQEIVRSQELEESHFVDNPRWVDATGARDVTLVQTAYSGNIAAMVTSFWNTSVTRISSLETRHIDPVEGLGSAIRMEADGLLVAADGSPIERPILFASSGTAAAFSDTVKVVPDRSYALIVPTQPIRLVGLAEGVRSNGTLAPEGRIVAYPSPGGRCSTVVVSIGVPADSSLTTLRLRQDGTTRTLRIAPGGTRRISLTSLATTGRTIEYDGWIAGATASRPFATSIALARFSARTSSCAKG